MRVHGCFLDLWLICAMTLLRSRHQDRSLRDQEVRGRRRAADESVKAGRARPVGDNGDLDHVAVVPPGSEGALGRRESAGVVPPEVRVQGARSGEGLVAVAAAEGLLERVPPGVVPQQPHGPESALAHATLEGGVSGVMPVVHVEVGLVRELLAAFGARVVLSLAAVRSAHVRLEVRLSHVGFTALAAQKRPLAAGRKFAKTKITHNFARYGRRLIDSYLCFIIWVCRWILCMKPF